MNTKVIKITKSKLVLIYVTILYSVVVLYHLLCMDMTQYVERPVMFIVNVITNSGVVFAFALLVMAVINIIIGQNGKEQSYRMDVLQFFQIVNFVGLSISIFAIFVTRKYMVYALFSGVYR